MPQIAFPPVDESILARRDAILAGLAAILPPDGLIADVAGRRAFETDALTAYRRLPLAVVLPRSSEEVARVMKFCRDADVNVVARGAGTSLSGGAIPQEDAIVLGLSQDEPHPRDQPRRPLRAGRSRALPTSRSPRRSGPTGSSTRPTPPRSSPAPSAATSR